MRLYTNAGGGWWELCLLQVSDPLLFFLLILYTMVYFILTSLCHGPDVVIHAQLKMDMQIEIRNENGKTLALG